MSNPQASPRDEKIEKETEGTKEGGGGAEGYKIEEG